MPTNNQVMYTLENSGLKRIREMVTLQTEKHNCF